MDEDGLEVVTRVSAADALDGGAVMDRASALAMAPMDPWRRGGNPRPKDTRNRGGLALPPAPRLGPTGRRFAGRLPVSSRSSQTVRSGLRVTEPMARDPRFREQLPSKHFSPAALHVLPSSAGWAGVAHDPERHHSSRQISWSRKEKQVRAECQPSFPV